MRPRIYWRYILHAYILVYMCVYVCVRVYVYIICACTSICGEYYGETLRKKQNFTAIHNMGSESIIFSKTSYYNGLEKVNIFKNVIGFWNMTSMRSSIYESLSLQVPEGVLYYVGMCVRYGDPWWWKSTRSHVHNIIYLGRYVS